MNFQHADRGFTLIELMVTVAIVAVIAAVALPAYTEQLARTRRGDAQAALLSTAQWLERQYTLNSAYNTNGDGTTRSSSDLPALPAGTAAKYTLSFSGTPTASDFTLQMVPTGSMVNDRCGTFTLTNTGAKAVTGAAGSAACWDR